jgi:hypothetical protein
MTHRSIFTLNDLRAAVAANNYVYPTPLHPTLYDRAKAEGGFEMAGYIRGSGCVCMREPCTYDPDVGCGHRKHYPMSEKRMLERENRRLDEWIRRRDAVYALYRAARREAY